MKKLPRIRVAVAVVRAHAVLLVQHQKNGRKYWLLPGGGLEFGESAKQAGAREVLEETGLEVEVGRLLLASETLAPDGSRHLLHLVFQGRVSGGELRCGEEERLCDARFVEFDELEKLVLHPPMTSALLQVLRCPPEGADPFLGNLWVD